MVPVPAVVWRADRGDCRTEKDWTDRDSFKKTSVALINSYNDVRYCPCTNLPVCFEGCYYCNQVVMDAADRRGSALILWGGDNRMRG